MSVDNQFEAMETAGMVKGVEKGADTQALIAVEEQQYALSEGETLPPKETVGVTEDDNIALSGMARKWFKGLTPEERSGAVCFSDVAFLQTFLQFASPWSSPATAFVSVTDGCGDEDEPGGASRDVDSSDILVWDAMVSISDFERKYEDVDNSIRKTPLLTNRKTPSGSDNAVIECDRQIQQTTVSADVAGAIDESNPFGKKRPNQLSCDRTNVTDSSRRDMFDQVSVIFPSAFKHIAGSRESHPFVTIRPSYFNQASDEEQFLALAQREKCFYNCDDVDKKNESLQWLRRLHDTSQRNAVVPLSTILLARFEWAAWTSFLEYECDGSRIRLAEIYNGEDHSSSNTVISDVRRPDNVRRHLLSTLGDVLSHCGAMHDLSMTIDSTTLRGFVSPFMDMCLTTNHPFEVNKSHHIENVILTPLTWVLFANGRVNPVDLTALDEAVDASLRRMEEHAPVELQADGMTSVDTAVEKLSDPEQSTPKKKKKKNKKKKKKKGQAAENLHGTSDSEHLLDTTIDDENDTLHGLADNVATSIEHDLDVVETAVISVESSVTTPRFEVSPESESTVEPVSTLRPDATPPSEAAPHPDEATAQPLPPEEATQQPSQLEAAPQPSHLEDAPQSSQPEDTPQPSQPADSPQPSQPVATLQPGAAPQPSQPEATLQPSRAEASPQPSHPEASPQPSHPEASPQPSHPEASPQVSQPEGVPQSEATPLLDATLEPESIPDTKSTEMAGNSSIISDVPASGSVVLPKSGETLDMERDPEVTNAASGVPAAEESNTEPALSSRNDTNKDSSIADETPPLADGDSWATVEVRGRGSRKKPSEKNANVGSRQPTHFSQVTNGLHDSHSKKFKSPRIVSPRKKSISKKIVRDILYSIVDLVEEESRKKRQTFSSPARTANSWKNGPPGVRQPVVHPVRRDFASVVASSAPAIGNSSRESGAPAVRTAVQTSKLVGDHGKSLLPAIDDTKPTKSQTNGDENAGRRASGLKAVKNPGADQNTAPTYQETVSASSNIRTPSREEQRNSEDRKSESSSAADTEEAPVVSERETPKSETEVGSTPPLPTLLSPENANSATSSVASSLEAPHAGRLHHHSVSAANPNDVGYHLLDVCDRLSRDMSLFMSRRALALSARRRERGAILAALQDSVSALWPRRCHAELYGSCATQLDLPSSDIDVVVLGLDRFDATFPGVSSSKSASSDSIGTSLSLDDASLTEDVQHPALQQHFVPATFGMMPMHRNAERVIRLAAELEGQPWAVQVNAIPTASVPVVKVLADPSKLTSNGGEWMAQHQHMAAQVAAAAGKCQSLGSRTTQDYSTTEHGSYHHPTLLPWRGSDVMKGLLSLDITFEGPEHGGIGSTEFSSRVVMEACAESGLHPDATPFVQVLMVLKELLSQRKLNEPYSGGLSSYALLLLVLALVRERAVIQQEIEIVEQQKRAMAASDPNSFGDQQTTSPTTAIPSADSPAQLNNPVVGGAPANPPTKSMAGTQRNVPLSVNIHEPSQTATKDLKAPKSSMKTVKSETGKNVVQTEPTVSKSPATSTAGVKAPASTWASIAKQNTAQKVEKASKAETPPDPVQSKPVQKPSFADAVMRSKKVAEPIVTTTAVSQVTKDLPEVKPSAPAKGRAWSNAVETKTPSSEGTTNPNTARKGSIEQSGPGSKNGSVGKAPQVSPLGDSTLRVAPPFYPQGYNDIVEVLCSGETTAGKLLMHFLLFYGQHFDAQSTAIDISGKHERDFMNQMAPFSYLSPYIQRRARGNIDPITGMLTVDPIVIYDPLEGAENNNVARRCFAWNSVRWIFAQSYATLASAVERCATPPGTPGGSSSGPVSPSRDSRERDANGAAFNPDAIVGDLLDPSSPLLKCLLSF